MHGRAEINHDQFDKPGWKESRTKMADLNDDIARYLDGRMTPAEMHALERKALDDPFLADALAGAETISSHEFTNDIVDLQRQLNQRVRAVPLTAPTGGVLEQPGRGRQTSMWSWPTRIAAGLLLLVSAGVVLYFVSDKNKDAGNLAMKTEAPRQNESSELVFDSVHAASEPDAFAKEQAGQKDAETEQKDALKSSSDKSAAAPLNQPADPAGALKKPGSGNVNDDTKNNDQAELLAGRVAGVQTESRKPVDASEPVLAEDAAGIPTDAEGPPASRAEQRAAEQIANAEKEESRDDAKANTRADQDNPDTKVARKDSPSAGFSNVESASPSPSRELAMSDFEKGIAASKRKAGESNAAEKTIFTGKVVDADGEAIPGVNVLIKGTNTGTVTDIYGEYHLVDSNAHPTLVFTFIGYTNTEEVAEASKPATVTLSEDLTQLSEVVVAGYGVAKERTPEESTLELATPVGGRRAFKQYLEKNLQYPPAALLNNVEGRVTVTFEVESTGALHDFKVIKGLGSGCDEEVIRLIKAGPKWTPTKRDEVAEKSLVKVRMRFQLPRKKK